MKASTDTAAEQKACWAKNTNTNKPPVEDLNMGRVCLIKDFAVCLNSAGQLEQVELTAPLVVVKNRAVNFTTVLHPATVGTVTYFWWFDNKTEVGPPFIAVYSSRGHYKNFACVHFSRL